MTTKCLIIDFSECTYSVKELTDEQIANIEPNVIRINGEQFEENICISGKRLLWTSLEATTEERYEKIKSFRLLGD
jgi:ABC-type Fe3+-citrate transport system substrate-binding protein